MRIGYLFLHCCKLYLVERQSCKGGTPPPLKNYQKLNLIVISMGDIWGYPGDILGLFGGYGGIPGGYLGDIWGISGGYQMSEYICRRNLT